MRENHIRTYPIKGLMIFLTIAFTLSLGAVIYFIIAQDDPMVVRVLVWIFCGVFSIVSLVVIMSQLFDYVEVKDNRFISHFFFKKRIIEIGEIDKVRNIDGVFHVYHNNQKVAQFYTESKQAQQIIVYLDQRHVKIEW